MSSCRSRLCTRHLHPPPPRREGPCTLRWASVWLVLSCQAGDVRGRCGWRGRPWGLRLPPLGASVSSSVKWGWQGLEGQGNRLGKDGRRGAPRSCGRTGPHAAPAWAGPRWHRPLAVEWGRDLSSAVDGFAVAVAGFPGVPGAPPAPGLAECVGRKCGRWNGRGPLSVPAPIFKACGFRPPPFLELEWPRAAAGGSSVKVGTLHPLREPRRRGPSLSKETEAQGCRCLAEPEGGQLCWHPPPSPARGGSACSAPAPRPLRRRTPASRH